MNRNRLYKVAFFVLILVGIDQFIGRFIAHYAVEYKYDKRVELLINNQLNKEIYVLGSSRALNGIDPETIQKQAKKSCYNLAFSGSNIAFHETILDLIINAKELPKTIIYTLDDPVLLDSTETNVIYKIEELYPYVYDTKIDSIVCNHLEKNILMTKISPTYHNNINLISTIKYFIRGKEKPSLEINNINAFGVNLMIGDQESKENMEYDKTPHQFKSESTEYVQSLLNIVSKCKKNNIQLIMVLPPIFYAPNKIFKNRIIELVGNDNIVLDYSTAFSDKQSFYNHGHLNKKGAIKFSELLTQFLKKDKN